MSPGRCFAPEATCGCPRNWSRCPKARCSGRTPSRRPSHDLFQLQDALTHAIVSALHVPLTAHDHRALRQDVPASAAAYELFLRANKLATDSSHWLEVRDLYERAVELDPGYAPAWARLGRVLRVIAKYSVKANAGDRARAERAFERALALNPDLATAHYLYAHLEAETGRATDAMVRLLTRARSRRADPELLAGLVTTCRYCGLLDESIAAYHRVQDVDAGSLRRPGTTGVVDPLSERRTTPVRNRAWRGHRRGSC